MNDGYLGPKANTFHMQGMIVTLRYVMSWNTELNSAHPLAISQCDKCKREQFENVETLDTRLSCCRDCQQDYQIATANPEDSRFINKISAGPMVEEDDKYMVGSFFIVEATREEAQKFVDNDPFKKVRCESPESKSQEGKLDVPGY